MPRTVINQTLALAPDIPASLFLVVDGDGDDVEVGVELELDVVDEVKFAVLTKT
jgi:hypothetical protein